jgi:streptomycin 6-kinase
VRLIDAREDVGAMLLERLDPDRSLEQVHGDEAVLVAGQLLRRLSIPPPPGLSTVTEELAELRAGLLVQWDRWGRPFPRRVLDLALDLAAAPVGDGLPRIVNQDLHYGNVLGGARERWLVIDPTPLAGHPEFGVAPLLWTRFRDLRSRSDLERRLDLLVEAAELDPRSARGMSVVRIVDYWLWAVEQGSSDDTEKCRALLGWLLPRLVG